MAEESLTYIDRQWNENKKEGPAQGKSRHLSMNERGDVYISTREAPGFLSLYKVIKAKDAGKLFNALKKMGYNIKF